MTMPEIDPTAIMIDQHFKTKFGRILDIGAAFGDVSRSLQRLHGSEIWILEGDSANNDKKTQDMRKGKWNDTADSYFYYHSLDRLRRAYHDLGATNFHIVDCDNINIPADIKFDLISSYMSCGFHYPLSTYYDLIRRHSHENTRYVFDLRTGKGNIVKPPEVEILHTFFAAGRKYIRCELKFNLD
jgi:hypothetical protein